MTTLLVFTIALLAFSSISALSFTPHTTRRQAISGWTSAALGTAGLVSHPLMTPAAEENVAISDEEMAARVARKQALLKSGKGAGGNLPVGATDIRSDFNPEASTNLRSRSVIENAKIAVEKQSEMKSRNKAQKRDDLCEMLGRGC